MTVAFLFLILIVSMYATSALKRFRCFQPSPFLQQQRLFARACPDDILKREFEHRLAQEGYRYIIGADEAGCGPIAGPVVAAALVLLPAHTNLLQAADSKVLTAKRREDLFQLINSDPTIICVHAIVSHTTIDEINILQASQQAMAESVATLLSSDSAHELRDHLEACFCLVDGRKAPKMSITSKPVIRGDALVYPIALASVIAKVTRDRLMVQYDQLYPEYGFATHKGYPTKQHILMLHKYGPCPIHRRSFKPVKGRVEMPLQPAAV